MNALGDEYDRKDGLSRHRHQTTVVESRLCVALKFDYELHGRDPSNLRYDFVAPA